MDGAQAAVGGGTSADNERLGCGWILKVKCLMKAKNHMKLPYQMQTWRYMVPNGILYDVTQMLLTHEPIEALRALW